MRRILFAILTILAAFWPLPNKYYMGVSNSLVWAAEQRCNDLGANCVCSEPFNMTALPVVNTFWANPNDTSSLECTRSGQVGASAEANPITKVTIRTDAAMINALPPGHSASIQRAIGGVDGHLGIFFLGNDTLGTNFVTRLSTRFYIYHSTDFQFAGEGVCTNSKLMQFTGPNSLMDKSFGYIHTYNFLAADGWNPGQDCCFHGPGPDQDVIQSADWRGNWWRMEMIYTNRAGGGGTPIRIELFAKNVTTNSTEFHIVDTWATGTQLVNGNTMQPPGRQDNTSVNMYRETGCNGWEAVSHYMVAGWDTDAGQRIGAAVEIEGGGTPPPPQIIPSTIPVNLHLTAITRLVSWTLIVLFSGGSFAIILLGVSHWFLGRRERYYDAGSPPTDNMDGGGYQPQPLGPNPVVRDAEREAELVGVGREIKQ